MMMTISTIIVKDLRLTGSVLKLLPQRKLFNPTKIESSHLTRTKWESWLIKRLERRYRQPTIPFQRGYLAPKPSLTAARQSVLPPISTNRLSRWRRKRNKRATHNRQSRSHTEWKSPLEAPNFHKTSAFGAVPSKHNRPCRPGNSDSSK